ncbi:MAG: hypothetical protein ACLPSW_29680 [Roseiarcus sp.]
MKQTRRRSLTFRQLSSIVLSQLYRVAEVHRAWGEILQNEPWLKVLANVLSAAPAGIIGSRRDRDAPEYFGLDSANLSLAARRCGLGAAHGEIIAQVVDTQEWRERETRRKGAPHYVMMRPDKIGELLGITSETRADARAWNLGTYGGSRKARAEATKERNKLAHQQRRRAEGSVSRAEYQAASLSQTKPWAAEGISRETWQRRRAAKKRAIEADASPSELRLTQVRPRQIRAPDASPSATIIRKELPSFRIPKPQNRTGDRQVEEPCQERDRGQPIGDARHDPETASATPWNLPEGGRSLARRRSLKRPFGYQCRSHYLNAPEAFCEAVDGQPREAGEANVLLFPKRGRL